MRQAEYRAETGGKWRDRETIGDRAITVLAGALQIRAELICRRHSPRPRRSWSFSRYPRLRVSLVPVRRTTAYSPFSQGCIS